MNNWNKKGLEHGYWYGKWSNGNPWYKYTLNNGMYLGYEKWYDANGNGKIRSKQINI